MRHAYPADSAVYRWSVRLRSQTRPHGDGLPRAAPLSPARRQLSRTPPPRRSRLFLDAEPSGAFGGLDPRQAAVLIVGHMVDDRLLLSFILRS